MANGTTLTLTVGLLLVPILLLGRDWMPKWIHKIPLAIISLAVIFRIYAFWTVDITDTQVAGYLPVHVTGIEAVLHIFDGPAGLMLGLLLGFSMGIALINPSTSECRWATLCWILLLGWGVDSDGFATISATHLTDQASILSWHSVVYPLLGLGLSIIVIPTLVHIENATTPRLVAAFCIGLVFLDISSSPVAWMLLSLLAHRYSSLRIHSIRGAATQHRWIGLTLTFFLSSVFIVIGLSWLAMPSDHWSAIWPSHFTVGWILLCGIAGALTPTMGYDANPRPEAWGFHTGVILAPALLPNLALIEHAHLPVFLLGITMPILATLPEYRPQITWKRRGLEAIILLSTLVFSLYLTNYIALSLIVIIVTLPLLLKFNHSVDEEE